MGNLLRSIGRGCQRLRRSDPSRLTSVWVAVVAAATAQGIAIPLDWDNRVRFGLAVVTIGWPLVQGELTRAQVYSPASVDAVAKEAATLASAWRGEGATHAARVAVDVRRAQHGEGLTPSSAIVTTPPAAEEDPAVVDVEPAPEPLEGEGEADEDPSPGPRHLRR